MPAAIPRRRRLFDGILSATELAFVRDEPAPGDGFEVMALEHGLMHRDPKSRAALAWRSASPQVLREWIRAHPGTRPRCWWAFDAPEPLRAIVRGRGEPLPVLGVDLGRPRSWADWTGDLAIESQAAYLRRHALLTAGESQRIAAPAFEPQAMVKGGRLIEPGD